MNKRMYELTCLISPDLSEEELQKLNAEIREILVKKSAEIKKEELRQKERLAYPVKKKDFGFYVSFDFLLEDGQAAVDIQAEIKSKKTILRSLMIIKPEKAQIVPRVPMLTASGKPAVKPVGDKKPEAKIIPERTPEEKKREMEEIDKKLEEILKD